MQHLSRRFSGYAYLYMAIAFIVTQLAIGLEMMDIYRFTGGSSSSLALLISYFIIFLPPLIMVAVRKYPMVRVLRINAFLPKYVWYAIGIGGCLYLFVHLFNSVINNLIGTALNQMQQGYFSSSSPYLWPYVLTSLIPVFFQVIAFQGIVQSGLHSVKPLKACLMVGLLFGLHIVGANALMGVSTLNLIGNTIWGFVLCYIVVQSGSIFPAMIGSFSFYMFGHGHFEDMLYKYCLSPLGVSESVSVIGLLALALILGGLLIVKMPHSEAGKPLRLKLPSFKGFRQKLTQPYLPVPENAPKEVAPEPAAPKPVDPLTEAANAAGDTAKNKNVGFIVGGVLLAALSIASLVYGISMIVTNYSSMVG